MIVAVCPIVAGPPLLTSLILKKSVPKPSVIVPAFAGTVPTCVVRLDLVMNSQSPVWRKIAPGCGTPCRVTTGRGVSAGPDAFKRHYRI